MYTAGIVAEYNPFHSGHRHQIAETRAHLGPDTTVVCVMSGNFVQRGDAAVADKWARAEMALRWGADVVLELPLSAALSSAEGFARGAVSVLADHVDVLSFGCEAGALEPLRAVAACLESEEFPPALRRELKGGVSFAMARQRAVERLLGPEAAAPLTRPNDILAIEYLRAIAGTELVPLAIPRRGAGHDASAEGEAYPSASALRQILTADQKPLPGWMPACDIWYREQEAGRVPAALERGERAVLALLRTCSPAEFAALPDSGGGLAERIYRASRAANSWQELLELAGTKHYTTARIRRICLRAALQLPETRLPDYLRLLGSTGRGRRWLAQAETPILTKPAHIRRLGAAAEASFAADLRAADLYGLCMPVIHSCDREWRTSPVTLP